MRGYIVYKNPTTLVVGVSVVSRIDCMDKFEILKILESNGHKAYIVGGFVRDHLLSIESKDIDIATSCRPEEVIKLFSQAETVSLGCVNLKNSQENIDITTFRKEYAYEKRHPTRVEFIDSLEEDLKRRDFTINAICMDKDGNLVDPLRGVLDLENRLIRAIGDVKTKFEEDPLRMLRAIRLAIIYNFSIDKEILDFIDENKSLIKELSYERKKTELNKILSSSRAIEGLYFLRETGLLETLEIDYEQPVKETGSTLGYWAQLRFNENYPFTRKEKSMIDSIKKIVNLGVINKQGLFDYGLDLVLIASDILGLRREEVASLYSSMSIHKLDELAIDGNMIKSILNEKSNNIIKTIKKDLINQVLSGNLPNSVEHLSEYIIKKWK